MKFQDVLSSSGAHPATSQWSLTELEAIWNQLDSQVTPFAQVLNIPGELFRALDAAAKAFIAHTFMSCVKEVVMFCRDGTGFDRYFLGNPRHFIKDGGMIVSVLGGEPFWIVSDQTMMASNLMEAPVEPTQLKEKKIPRPPNAYILYRKERHSMVKENNPGITNNQISQVLGAAWNRESREIRQKYKAKSEKIKQELLEKHPNYQYKPRKPSEKKRRARRNTETQQPSAQAEGEGLQMSSPESIEGAIEEA